jgi:hypothetical protein
VGVVFGSLVLSLKLGEWRVAVPTHKMRGELAEGQRSVGHSSIEPEHHVETVTVPLGWNTEDRLVTIQRWDQGLMRPKDDQDLHRPTMVAKQYTLCTLQDEMLELLQTNPTLCSICEHNTLHSNPTSAGAF